MFRRNELDRLRNELDTLRAAIRNAGFVVSDGQLVKATVVVSPTADPLAAEYERAGYEHYQ